MRHSTTHKLQTNSVYLRKALKQKPQARRRRKVAPRKEPLQRCECRIGFQTSFDQDDRINQAASRKKISKAEWLRQAAETQLKRQRL